MGILSLVRLLTRFVKGADLVAFLASAFLAFMVASLLPQGTWANYAFILVAYHLFLAWLIIDADHGKGLSLPIGSTILTHAACIVIVIPFGMGGSFIPLFSYFRAGVAALAVFERDWIFRESRKMKEIPVSSEVNDAASMVNANATGEDYAAWSNYLTHRDPRLRKPGMSVKEEYEQWMVARIKSRSRSF
jgi:hypothetical protein